MLPFSVYFRYRRYFSVKVSDLFVTHATFFGLYCSLWLYKELCVACIFEFCVILCTATDVIVYLRLTHTFSEFNTRWVANLKLYWITLALEWHFKQFCMNNIVFLSFPYTHKYYKTSNNLHIQPIFMRKNNGI